MTVQVEQAIDGGHHHDVSGTVVQVLIGLVYARSGDTGVAQALALADDGRSFAALADAASWSSLPEAVALLNAAALVSGDGAVGLHVGERLLSHPDGTDFVERLAALGSPVEVFKHIGAIIDHFETLSVTAPLEIAADHALVEVSPRRDETRHPHLCEMTRGLLSRVPTLFGRGPALISENECSARGGRFCLYAVSWAEESGVSDDPTDAVRSPRVPPTGPKGPEGLLDKGGDGGRVPRDRDDPGGGWTAPADRTGLSLLPTTPDAVEAGAADLRDERDRLRSIVEGATATANELLHGDVDSLLAEIADRADAAVGTERFLLMLRVRPDAPLRLHYRGLAEDEAQSMAAELWRGEPADDGDSRLIVDIDTSRHHYGRLVEFVTPGDRVAPNEAELLGLLADDAAAALEIFGVLTAARQSDATARELLAFSEALSRLEDAAGLVRLVADTVPSVTGCDQSTVYLWQAEEGRLEPRARTSGLGAPDAYLGPIVPVGAPPPGEDMDDEPPDVGDQPFLTIRTDTPLVDRLLGQREVMVLDDSTDDPFLRSLLDRTGTTASVVAPLFAGAEFLGVVAANFGQGTTRPTIEDGDLHERLSGLANQAATALKNLVLKEHVSHLAWHDALTGLPNRRLFEDRVEQELVRSRRVGEPVCMFFVDIDHFKSVNDTLGHAAGDDLIRQVGQRLVDTVRRQDTVARVGGDEFAILLPGLSEQSSIDQLAQRSLEAMSMPFGVFDDIVESSASIGIAMAPDHGDTYDDLLSRADEAMYRAKARGRNAFQMYTRDGVERGTEVPVLDERTLEADLVHALEADEFFVLYQPYIDLRTTRVVGVEALVRWLHPSLGVLEPSSFIAVAEKSDVIVDIDARVLEQTCRQAQLWLDHGLPPLRLSVNLASRDLSSPEFFDHIEGVLEETGIDPSQLELEITERVVMDKGGPARDNVERLRRLGVRFTVDDFGTGNSSLSRIGSFPVSTLKIDQSFVQVLGPEDDSNTLVSAIISMADRLGLACVAEGVETALQSRVLLQRGCTTAQGYFFSPPLPAEGIEKLMVDIASGDSPLNAGGHAG